MDQYPKIAIIGGGLAGCEAAYQLGCKGFPVTLFEMRPQVKTPAHKTGALAELVCSNSFKSLELSNAHGLLKAEMEATDSLIVHAAKKNALPAGSALAVDRDNFSSEITARLKDLVTVEIKHEEIKCLETLQKEFPLVILAGGPLISEALSLSLQSVIGEQGLFFYDAIAPVIHTESINMEIAFKASRYGKGEADYINCPLNKQEYGDFIFDLISATKVPFKDFEQAKHFEGCLPIEEMARRGSETLSFGPMKPVGLTDPRTGQQPWAVLQLRQENQSGTLFNMVGCQTRMVYPEQNRVFRKIPGLENCEFARMGSMHRNTYVNAPLHLTPSLELKNRKGIYLAGQITGVEGYIESASMGLWVAMQIISNHRCGQILTANPQNMMGALVNYLLTASPVNFQPMNANFGLLRSMPGSKIRNKKERRKVQAELALESWKNQLIKMGWSEGSDRPLGG